MGLASRCIATAMVAAAVSLAAPAFAQAPAGADAVAVKDRAGKTVTLYKKSHALVVGVSNYTGGWPALRGVRDDVPAVEAALAKHGFAVTVVMDPDRDGLERAFRDFVARHGHDPEGRLLFYFAGHGHTMTLAYGGEMGYLVPKDAPDPNKDRAGFHNAALSMETIQVHARRIQSKHALFVFDSCFSGAIFEATRAIPEVIADKTARPVRQFITSGTAEQKVPDKSIFRDQFVAALAGEGDLDKDGYVTGAELGQFLESKVTNYSRRAQTPQYGKLRDPILDKGDFVFALARPSLPPAAGAATPAPLAPAAPAATPAAPADREVVFWQSIQASTNAATFEEYLRQFPKGQFAGLARIKLEELKVARAPAPPRPAPPAKPVQPAVGVYPGVPGPGQSFKDCDVCPEMVVVPAGRFEMGDENSDQKPVHRVTIPKPFAVGKYEVTFAEWDACVAQGGCNGHRPVDEHWGRGNRPVIKVSWDDAKAYAAWLSKRTGKKYRLPTEAEWEYAARAGTTTTWSCGAQESCLDGAAWYTKNAGLKTQPVGGKAANGFGLHDMHGNVWEWTEDCWNAGYAGAPTDGGAWTSGDCSQRVLRGGSWSNLPRYLRAANRFGNYSTVRYYSYGFRMSRTLLR